MRIAGAHTCNLLFLEKSFINQVSYRLWENTYRPISLNQHSWPPRIHRRGAKSKTTVKSHELPQGVLQPERLTQETVDDGPSYPVVVQQARNNMQKFENCVLLTRVGGFYELYFEHAVTYGPLLNLKVAQKRTSAGSVPMAGFPFFQVDRFLKILVQDLSKFVAISEEFANTAAKMVKSGGLLFDRKVTRIITPGTLIDEKFMDPYENNFLLAIEIPFENRSGPEDISVGLTEPIAQPLLGYKHVGLAWLDLSTGDFFTQTVEIGTLPSALARIGAREVVLSDDKERPVKREIMSLLKREHQLVTYHGLRGGELPISMWTPMLEAAVLASEASLFSREEAAAGNLLLDYVKEKLQGLGLKLQPPVRKQDNENMIIDKSSLRGLEVLETSKDGLRGGKGSLLHLLRRTSTKSGARLLKDWLASPSMSLHVINARLDLVSQFRFDEKLNENIRTLLRRTYDSQRIVQKFSMGRGDAEDLISLLRTVEATIEVASILEKSVSIVESAGGLIEHRSSSPNSLTELCRRISLEEPRTLARRISNAIDEEGLMQSHRVEENQDAETVALAQGVLLNEGTVDDQNALSSVFRSRSTTKAFKGQENMEEEVWIMRRSASSVLALLHHRLLELFQSKATLTSNLREKLGAQSLSLRWTPGTGYVCHVKGAKDVRSSLDTSNLTRDVKSTRTTRLFHHPEWSKLGGNIDQVKVQIRAEEQHIFQRLREQVILNLVKLRRNAVVLDELDIASSFATLAQEQGLVRPVLNLGCEHTILGGRHPTVTLGLEEEGRAFVGNDCFLGEKERIWLITGPNMAGKSTFLRQNALISILAQVGSFVPADHAEIGLVDRIFSRVGSADDLFRDQSTFMVEMLETATILNQATPRSFVIMDEIGRGTTPKDGIAIGYACLHHLYHTNQCRTLFATHFHALADMSEKFPSLGYYCTDIAIEDSGSFSYVHRLRKGVNRESHALKVARLAGIPNSAIEVAQQVLDTSKLELTHAINQPKS